MIDRDVLDQAEEARRAADAKTAARGKDPIATAFALGMMFTPWAGPLMFAAALQRSGY